MMERYDNKFLFKFFVLILATSVLFASESVKSNHINMGLSQFKNQEHVDVYTYLPAINIDFMSSPYEIFIHNSQIKNYLHNNYNSESIKKLESITFPARQLSLVQNHFGTFIEAASFEDKETAAKTNYNAIWLRDSLWGYLALSQNKGQEVEAKKVLMTLWDYMSSTEQLQRMRNVVKDPSIIEGPDGQMSAVHIRFDKNSSNFSDVYENGKPQFWNHKQNDALGLFLDTLVKAINSGLVTREDWCQGARLDAIVYLVAYIDSVRFYEMQDSGTWEENERLNTSSIALVVSGLERILEVTTEKELQHSRFAKDLIAAAKKHNMERFFMQKFLNKLITRGYDKIALQLSLGGESPDYRKNHSKYREADAALLNLIYPATLTKLTVSQKRRVMEIVRTLAGSYGIKRYINDNYQSANFWFNDIKTDVSEEANRKRVEDFIPGTEAQWFFDSWYSLAASLLYKETKDVHYFNESIMFMNRSVSQITGDNMMSANARKSPLMAIPESYNYIYCDGRLIATPSPIIPLNWAKASMSLMFKSVGDMIEYQISNN